MKYSTLAVFAVSAVPAVVAAPRGCAAEVEVEAGAAATGKAIYFITNDAENAVVAIPVGADGSLSGGVATLTGGQGSTALGADGKPAVPDALVSQSALSIAGQNLFTVNAGSNTLSMLAISAEDPTVLTVLSTVAVPGEFPNTVTASLENRLVCVGTSGAVAGVSCATFADGEGIVGEMDGLRPIDLGQTTPPVGPLNTVSQVFFSDTEDSLFVTVKGDPGVGNTGFLSVFPVEQDCSVDPAQEIVTVLSDTDVRSSPNGTAVLFGALAIPGSGNKIFTTDASFGAGILSVAADDTAILDAAQALDGQAATCWVTISSLTQTAFVTDVGVNRVTEMSLKDASIVGDLDLSANGNPGLIDLRASGGFIYALSPGDGTIGASVSVLDISGGAGTMAELQKFELGELAGANSMGMVVLE